jgi:glycosyltransferase involved in cell wall biosynthesis
MRIWLVSKFEQTPVDQVFSTRFLSIAEEALRRGHEVTFIGSTFKHNTKNQRFARTTEIEHKPGYKLLFVQSQSYQRNISPRRLWAHYTYSKELVRELEMRARPDVILMAFPPVSVVYALSRWAKSQGIPTVMDIIDPWPDTFSHTFPKIARSLAGVLLGPMRKRLREALRNISGLTAISQQYITWASGYHDGIPRKQVFYPAVEMEQVVEAVRPWRTASRSGLQVIYAGSLASSYDLPCILAAAALLEQSHPDIKFTIAGAGPQAALVEAYQQAHGNLEYVGRLPKAELMEHYAAADLGLTQHVKGASQSVTYKLFDLLAAGLPILNSLESEMKDIILSNEVGRHNAPGDAKQLAENICWFYEHRDELERYQANGYHLTGEVGDAAVVYRRFVDLLEQSAIEHPQEVTP